MNSKIKFNVAYIKLSTKTEGPYNRCCIWFQGCNIKCKGCCNKDLQSLVPNHIVTLEELANIVKEAKNKFNIAIIAFALFGGILNAGRLCGAFYVSLNFVAGAAWWDVGASLSYK